MNVKFDEAGTEDYFVASASVGNEGESILKIHEKFLDDMPGGPGELPELPVEFKAIMHRSDTAGYGKVDYLDFEALFGPDADPNLNALPHIEAKYAYNEDYLAVKEGDHDVQYKDRTTVTEMTHRYGVYHGDTGQDVMKIKSFGFPIRYTSNGLTRHAYYGAWQGRHQIWTHGEGDTIPEGTEVIREDTSPDEPAETYTVGDTFRGTLLRRTVVDADIADIKGIPVEIWIDQDYHLLYDEGEGKWFYCTQMDWEAIPPECVGDSVDFDAEVGFESLIVGANDDRKHVNIYRWDDAEGSKDYVYEAASADNGGQAGFYEASWRVNGKLTVNTPRVRLDAANNADERDLWVYIGGSLYVEYTGTGWVEKEVVSFNSMTWTPEFNEDGDKPYILPEGREYYVNMEGANYIVKRTGQTYITKREIQTAANPSNATTLVDAGTDLKDQWNPDGSSTYEFITDAGNENYLMLVYKTVGDNDKDPQGNDEAQVGAVVQRDLWGLQAYVNGAAQETMYSWEYRGENENWGSVTYLMDANGDYKLLDDPMRFDAITAANNAGEEKTLVLQYDGWMMGLPQMYEELMKNDWVMTDEIADKIINLPAGTEVIESDTGTSYLLKPLEISQFLNQVTDTIGLDLPDISEADTVDLGTVPDFVEHGMGDMPEVTTVKYSEGNLVE